MKITYVAKELNNQLLIKIATNNNVAIFCVLIIFIVLCNAKVAFYRCYFRQTGVHPSYLSKL